MIISKTPLRISFFGGGSDIPSFYNKNRFGSVLSSSINKYIYVTLKKQSKIFYEKYRLNYSKAEIINDINKIKNPIIRESIKFLNIQDNIYINTISDIPSSSGLGSSSSFCVGLLNALHKFKGENVSKYQLAEEACHIEIDILKKPIGKQDQFAASFGGFNNFKFYDNKVLTKKLNITKENSKILNNNVYIFWSGITRSADKILFDQNRRCKNNYRYLNLIRDFSNKSCKLFNTDNKININKIGKNLDASWQSKKLLSKLISNNIIDKAYNVAKKNGAIGGKILGAGGGGFLLLVIEKKNLKKVNNELNKINFKNINFNFENKGTIVKQLK